MVTRAFFKNPTDQASANENKIRYDWAFRILELNFKYIERFCLTAFICMSISIRGKAYREIDTIKIENPAKIGKQLPGDLTRKSPFNSGTGD
jgi:hypothetical protein